MALIDEIRDLLKNSLILGEEIDALDPGSPLLGSFRELDSVGVMAVVTAIEDHFDVEVDDTEISTEVFKTLGSLVGFVERKTT
jgi:acyl carrier protein